MKIVEEEKLDRFTNDIMNDVRIQKQGILQLAEEENKAEYDRKHTEFLNENYELVQKSMKKIDKEKNEIMSQIIMANRKRLFNKRAEVIDAVVEITKERLYQHTQKEEYFNELVSIINKCIDSIGKGDLEIIISYSDMKHKEALEKIFGKCITIENKNIEMIGGCKLLNKTAKRYVDESYAKRLEEEKDTFLQNCKINVE